MQCSSVNATMLPLYVVSVASPHTLLKVSISVLPTCGPFCLVVVTLPAVEVTDPPVEVTVPAPVTVI